MSRRATILTKKDEFLVNLVRMILRGEGGAGAGAGAGAGGECGFLGTGDFTYEEEFRITG